MHFSSFQNEIFEACKVNYGEPWNDDGWTRGDQKLRAKAWRGEKVGAAILAPPNQAWDWLVIYAIQANQKAQEYEEKEPERAATDFGLSGFKSLVFGMQLQDLTVEFDVMEEDRVAAVKKVVFKKDDWQTVGFYPLKTVTAEFFKDKLYRINLGFEENRKEMFETFQHRFGPLQDNDTWTRGSMKLKGKSAISGKVFAIIFVPRTSFGYSDSWDAIVLLETAAWRESEQFKKDAPKRAAKDF